MLESIYKNSNSWIQVINVIVFVLESYIDNSFWNMTCFCLPQFYKRLTLFRRVSSLLSSNWTVVFLLMLPAYVFYHKFCHSHETAAFF
jgi:hypothetical protein